MSKLRIAGLLMVGFGVLAFGFNNCSQVDFAQAPEKPVDAASIAEPAAEVGTTLDQTTIEEIIAQLPPEEVDVIRPVTDLDNDPTLYDIYKCPNSDGVVICHFPNEVEASATKCVGRSAVKSHYDHIRNYTSATTNEPKTIGDYLGPCRFSL